MAATDPQHQRPAIQWWLELKALVDSINREFH